MHPQDLTTIIGYVGLIALAPNFGQFLSAKYVAPRMGFSPNEIEKTLRSATGFRKFINTISKPGRLLAYWSNGQTYKPPIE